MGLALHNVMPFPTLQEGAEPFHDPSVDLM